MISDISSLRFMTKLTEVDMEHNKIFDISMLDRINLTSLGLTKNRIEDVR